MFTCDVQQSWQSLGTRENFFVIVCVCVCVVGGGGVHYIPVFSAHLETAVLGRQTLGLDLGFLRPISCRFWQVAITV